MAKPIEGSFPKDAPNTTEDHPTQEEIAVRPYEIYIERGATPGQDLDDWLEAEAELSENQAVCFQFRAHDSCVRERKGSSADRAEPY